MDQKIPEYTVHIPKREPLNRGDVDNINKFTVDFRDHKLVSDGIPTFNAGYALIHSVDGIPIQESDKLNILKIPGGKDYSVGLAHLLGRWYNHKNSPHTKGCNNVSSGSEQQIISILGDRYHSDIIRDLQIISHTPELKKALIDTLQLKDQNISKGLRNILSLSRPVRWKSLFGLELDDLFKELFRSSHSSWDNAVRECREETGILMDKSLDIKPYLIINQLKFPSKRGPVIKRYSFYDYHGSINNTGITKPSMSEAEYKFEIKKYKSVQEASSVAFTKIEDKIKRKDQYKMPIGLINARALQYAPKK